MNISTSEHSSGCESGWTTYLDRYTTSLHATDIEEDLSMVSDASSGPPNCRRYQSHGDYKMERNKNKSINKPKKEHKSLCLDDTASSSIFQLSHEDNVPRCDDHNSVGHVYFEDESITKNKRSFFKSSTKGKSGSLLGRKRQ